MIRRTARIARRAAAQRPARAAVVPLRRLGGAAAGESTTHFGSRTVPEAEKESMVGEVFSRVAESYDVMNDLMSAGVHRLWKESFVRALGPQAGMRVLDVAGGTGDIAFRCLEAAGAAAPPRAASVLGVPGAEAEPFQVVVLDINADMVEVGRRRAVERGLPYNPAPVPEDGSVPAPPEGGGPASVSFAVGNAERLPFADATFDAYTIAFGLRNVTHTDAALAEAYRVLRPGGRFMCMEFSPVQLPVLKQLYDAYSFSVIPALGELVANDRASYEYLVESIRNFYEPDDLRELMDRTGFAATSYEAYTGGICHVHSGFKL